MTVRESIRNDIYALEVAKRVMEDLLAKFASYELENGDVAVVEYIRTIQDIVIPELDSKINGYRHDLATFPETILDMDLLKTVGRDC